MCLHINISYVYICLHSISSNLVYMLALLIFSHALIGLFFQARLRPHIHDPNAPELVHFLFTPLSLVVEASKDPRHGTPDIAARVVSPMLTAEAKELLMNCLSSKETSLWHSLGEAWTLSRSDHLVLVL